MSRILFDHPNMHLGFKCPICHTSADRPVVLVPIPGTERGNNMEAEQVHAECQELMARMEAIAKEEKS
jgi:hypothetical protein